MPNPGYIIASIAFICLTSAAAMGFESMTATIQVSSGTLYDYVIIGEHPRATDGYDNTYDTISPGNLNADMGLSYISMLIIHPEWKRFQDLRGDIRSPSQKQEWQLAISSSLPKGTPLTVALLKEKSKLPGGVKMTLLKDKQTTIDLAAGNCTLPAPGPGTRTTAILIVEQ